MREPDGTQLPLVQGFGEQLERAIAGRAGPRRRSRWRTLALACAAGLVAASVLTSPGRAATGLVGEWLGLALPGDSPTVDAPRGRGGAATEPTGSVVVASGHAPDGARYEFVFESVAEPASTDPPGGELSRCLNIEWPDAPAGQISPQFGCAPAFPPDVVDESVVTWPGTMFDPTYTSHIQIAGLTRSDVGDVRIRYVDRHGSTRDTPVDFARVSGELRQRTGADRSFGVFIGFLPQAWLGYGASFDPRRCPPEEHPYDPEGIEVTAYDDHGEVIARKTGNNILSTGGRPPCP